MVEIPKAAQDQYAHIQGVQIVALKAARRSWAGVDQARISETWIPKVRHDLTPVITAAQVNAATAGSDYSAMTLAQQGTYSAPTAYVDPRVFGGYAADGRPLETLLDAPAYRAKQLIGSGVAAPEAMSRARDYLDVLIASTVTDAARQSASVDIAARPGVGYTRMLNPPSCSRCTILAGRFYRWNRGFRRHPSCDCVHVATKAGSTQGALSEGLIQDPYEYFNSLSEAQQTKLFGKYNATAIRDGADISQVVNAASRSKRIGMFTTEGTTKRGYAGSILKPNQRRMTPDTIYRLNPTKEGALADLRAQGYLLPQGQVPTGAIRGQAEGFGALGAGGQRRAASQAVLDARATGVRDPNVRYTMTEAERRVYDAKTRYETALTGRDPFTSPGFGNTPDPYGIGTNTSGAGFRPATPEILAQTEKEYRRQLIRQGEIFTD